MKLSSFCNKISLILQAIGCAVLYFFIEAISRHSFVEAWAFMTDKPLVFAYNAGFIFVTMLVVYLFRSECFCAVSSAAFGCFWGAVNGIILSARVTPFTGRIFTCLQTV